MTKSELDFTIAWWTGVCADVRKLHAWLQKLQQTELEGAREYYRAVATYLGKMTHAEHAKMIHIATDEARHASMIRAVLRARGVQVNNIEVPSSAYWAEIGAHIHDLHSFAAANYFGEQLAAERFSVIANHNSTPDDVRELVRQILPDEMAHHRMLERLAGDDAIHQMRTHHETATNNLKGNK